MVKLCSEVESRGFIFTYTQFKVYFKDFFLLKIKKELYKDKETLYILHLMYITISTSFLSVVASQLQQNFLKKIYCYFEIILCYWYFGVQEKTTRNVYRLSEIFTLDNLLHKLDLMVKNFWLKLPLFSWFGCIFVLIYWCTKGSIFTEWCVLCSYLRYTLWRQQTTLVM